MLNPPINHMHAHHATLENANNRQVRGAVHAVCCICWAHRIPYAFRILHRSPTLILDTLKQDARKYFIHAHGVSGRRMFVFFVVGDGAALAEWCYWRLQPKAVIESYMDVAALAAELKKKVILSSLIGEVARAMPTRVMSRNDDNTSYEIQKSAAGPI